MKSSFFLAATASAAALLLGACSASVSDSAASGAPSGGAGFSIGITQITTHPSLDAAREGFKKAFEDAGLEVEFDEQNAQGDQATATSIASKFAGADLDLVLAIATPSAQAAAQAITGTPILFTAVTDPVSAQLVDSLDAPGANVTGTTDMNPVADQISLVKQFAPGAKSVGIIYSSGEVNSEVQVELAKEAADKEGLEVVETTVTNSSEVQQAAQDLASKVDAIYVPTDNTVVSAFASVVQSAEDAKIPLIAGEGDSVANGGLATYGIDYFELGRQTGEMAIKILTEKADPATMPVQSQSEYALTVNTTTLKAIGLEMPTALADKAVTVE
ncbi:MAG: ABC transporter substrate-binding protein [Schaalia hyovaginalis]|uniref:ABC transporter substrate-binding protein n=1 Tax=Schaalia hyovaginalis TaxID=29316 RepID=UPI0026EB659E|nr:ABC transporter substrate-binding protein [Schaalia hyovaginalis]MCI6411416.1 ABC transporter substrate-binding protein [Schaalia hyovaginalis]MCI7513415.1 ABC transporter substrate-binding protein [Schaalia hyovaginalis]MDY3666225.1 ABC transporter substrate-binding protein [Schaalia hyovaginalis]MDY4262655.1 ABC transporter substrate-binding protein [Schaalia hyovaginalis]